MSEDLHDFLDPMDHQELIQEFKRIGLMAIKPLTKSVVSARLGYGDATLSGEEFLNMVSNLYLSNKSLSNAVSDLKAAQTQTSSATESQTIPKSKNATARMKKTSAVTGAQPPTQKVEVRVANNEGHFSDARTYVPIAAPILLYLLVTLAVGGMFLSMKTPSSMALFLGLVFATLIPAMMPSHPVHVPLAAVSGLGWFMIFLASISSLDASDAPQMVQNLSQADDLKDVYPILVFFMLCMGVALFGNPSESRMWTRRMANNIALFSVLVLFLALLTDDLNDENVMMLVTANLVGLWGVSVLGQTQPINLREAVDLLAIFSLAVSLIGYMSLWEYNRIVLGILLLLSGGFAFLAPNLQNRQHSAMLLAVSATLIVALSLIVASDGTPVIHVSIVEGIVFLSLVLVIAQMETRYREMNTSESIIQKILPPSASLEIDHVHEIESDIAVLGFKGAGKTSFFGGLWLALSDSTTRDLWYGSSPLLTGNRELGFSVDEIKDLLKDTMTETESRLLDGSDDIDVLKEYLKHRSALFTMQHEFLEFILPPTSQRFPLDVSITRQTRMFLESFSDRLADPNPMTRSVADATQMASESLSLTLRFPAVLSETYPVWFGTSTKTRKRKANVHNRIHSMDVPGEHVAHAVSFMEGKRIRSRTIDALLEQIMTREEEFGDFRFAIEYIVKMIAQYKHVVFLIDADEFTKIGGKGQPVGAFLRLADELAKLRGASLKKITLLLNKSDRLINRSAQGNRNMPRGGLNSWEDLMSKELARETLEEVLSPALLYNLQIDYDVYFTCTLGGVMLRSSNDGKGIEVPTFPMVPLHVVEPILRTMMVEPEGN